MRGTIEGWKGGRWEDKKMKKNTNYKIQITNESQITMPEITNPMSSCLHASMQYHSNSLLFPIFISSQLPSFPLYPLAAGGKRFMINTRGYMPMVWLGFTADIAARSARARISSLCLSQISYR
jgi:hypothetical protein